MIRSISARYSTKVVPQTQISHPHIKRYENFKRLAPEDLSYFAKVVETPNAFLYSTKPEDLEIYNTDWMGKYRGQTQLVLKPSTTEQVSSILKYCNTNSIAVCPQGGNTGLVGGGVPIFDEIILNTQRMDKIKSFDPISGIVVCQAGVVLENLDNYLHEIGFTSPLDLGAKGSCHVGGNVATNAGGLRLLRYGSLHGTVLGLEVVLADGTIMNSLSSLRKDNTGLDLKQLFIGAEGTLGLITQVSLLTPKKPSSVNVSMLALKDYKSVQKAFVQARTDLSEILSAFEFWDSSASSLIKKHLSHVRNPFEDDQMSPFYVLIETQGSNLEHDSEKLNTYLETLFNDGLIDNGVVAQDETQIKNMWSIREGIPEACSKSGVVYKYDISLPVPVLYEMVRDVKKRLSEFGVYTKENGDGLVKNVVGYGHVGDGNLHLNITAKEYTPELTKMIEPFVYEWAQQYNGSISAEHGLGLMKAPYIKYSKSKEMIDMMYKLKAVFDPKGILNPYKYLPNK